MEPRILLAGELTEGNASSWAAFTADGAFASVTDSPGPVKEGHYDIRLHSESLAESWARYPATNDANWDLEGDVQLTFWIDERNLSPAGWEGNQPVVVLNTATGSYRYEPSTQQLTGTGWKFHAIPLSGGSGWTRTAVGTPDLAHVRSLEFHHDTVELGRDPFNNVGYYVHYDGLRFVRRAPADYDGDGLSDLATYRFDAASDSGRFSVRPSASPSAPVGSELGGVRDIPVSGDFDGDGRADVAVFQPEVIVGASPVPNSSRWVIDLSSTGQRREILFGAAGVLDRPAPADYDGDGRTDIATFRANSDLVPGAAQWFILPSGPNPGYATMQGAFSVVFGAPGGADLPAPADYDGDGKADIATFRPDSDLVPGAAQWFFLPSGPNASNYQTTFGGYSVVFGAASGADQPVVADYDADGRADIAVFRSRSDLVLGAAQWFILPSESNQGFPVTFGDAGEVAAPGDYDGDGAVDLAVFDPETSAWRMRSLSADPMQRDTLQANFGPTSPNVVPVLAPLAFRVDAANQAVGTTRIVGRVLDTGQSPIAGVPVEVGTSVTTTAADGSFTLETPGVLPSSVLIVRGEGQGAHYHAAPVADMLGHAPFDGFENVIERPIYLVRVDANSAQVENTARDFVVEAPAGSSVSGASLSVSGGSVRDAAGNPVTGPVTFTITEVPPERTPMALPPGLLPALVVTVQPQNLSFTERARLSVPNIEGFEPGTEFDLWSMEGGGLRVVGTGRVSADGSVVETVEGGILSGACDFYTLRDPAALESVGNKDQNCLDDQAATVAASSQIELHSGELSETHQLVTYQSQGVGRGLTLRYDSLRADPRPIVHARYQVANRFENTRIQAKLAIDRGDMVVEAPGLEQPQLGLTGGENFWAVPVGPGNDVDIALQFDASDFPTGRFDYALDIGLLRFLESRGRYRGSTRETAGKVLVVNEVGGPFGNGWGIAGLQRIVENADGSALLVDGNGSEIVFEGAGGGTYRSPMGDFSTLEKVNGRFRRTLKDRTTYIFDTLNRLELVRDSNGNETRYEYDGERLARVVDPVGLATNLHYRGDYLWEIVDPADRSTRFTYDSAGNLTRVTDPDGTSRAWEYDDRNRMIAETDQRGFREEAFYDTSGRAIGARRADGTEIAVSPLQARGLFPGVLTRIYQTAPTATSTSDLVATSRDGRGHTTRFELDRAGQIVRASDEIGGLFSIERNEQNLVRVYRDARGNETRFEYDAAGNVTRTTDRAPVLDGDVQVRDLVRTFAYDPVFNQPTRVVDELGRVVLYDIDPANGNVRSITSVVGEDGGEDDVTTRFDYTATGLVDAVVDPLGRTTDYAYDGWGRLASITFAAGTAEAGTQSFEYDAAGNPTLFVDENANRTVSSYDNLNRLRTLTEPDPDGLGGSLTSPVTEFSYDAAGNLFFVVDARQNVTFNEFDGRNRLTRVTDASHQVTEYRYDGEGNLTEILDPLGHRTVNRYDARGRLVETVDPEQGTTAFAYDLDDNLVALVDPEQNRTQFEYDSRSRLMREVAPTRDILEYVYDATDNLRERRVIGTRTQDRTIAFTDFADLGPLTLNGAAAQINRQPVVFGGQAVLRLTDNGGQSGSAFSEQPFTFGQDGVNPPFETAFSFQITDPQGISDNDGRGADGLTFILTDRVDRVAGNGLGIGYSGINPSLVVEFDTFNNGGIDGNNGNHVGINVNGNLASIARAPVAERFNDGGVWYAWVDYDGTTLEVRVSRTSTRPDQPLLTAPVDLKALFPNTNTFYAGFTSGTASASGDHDIRSWSMTSGVTEVEGIQRRTSFEYDELDRLVAERWVDAIGAVSNVVQYAYDKNGNLRSVQDGFSALAFDYDARDRVRMVDNAGTPNAPRVVLQYAYDAVGNVRSVTDAINGGAGTTTSYAYDALNRATSIVQAGPQIRDKRVDLAYNPLGQFAAITRFSDAAGSQVVARTSYDYDALNRLDRLTHRNAAGGVVSFFDLGYDASSRITSIADVDGTATYRYDRTSQLIGVDYGDAGRADEAYDYDANGNRTSSHRHGDGYASGPGNQLTSDGTYTYAYDNEGNLVLRTEIATGASRSFKWDHRNRLTAVVDQDRTGVVTQRVEYRYDAHDRRIAKVVNGAITHFVYDGEDVILDFADADGVGGAPPALAMRYLHGPAVDQVLAQEDQEGTVRWLLADHLGTVHDLVDNQGQVVNHLAYDAFGNVIGQTNAAAATRYRFTGREFDGETGLSSHRARYYDGSLGRFISEDPIQMQGGDYNFYRYAANNPAANVDLNGLKTCVIITRDPGPLGLGSFGSHAALWVERGDEGGPVFYDPGGGYQPNGEPRGSGGFFTGQSADLQAYLEWNSAAGSTAEIYCFDTTREQEEEIFSRIQEQGDVMGGGCANAVSSGISGIGPFQNLSPSFIFPGSLGNALDSLLNPSGASSPATFPRPPQAFRYPGETRPRNPNLSTEPGNIVNY